MGSAATILGTIQVTTSIAGLGSSEHTVAIIATLRLIVCGSLATVGVLALVNLWRERQRNQR